MGFRVLVLDLDGTLTNSKKEITPRTLDALFEVQRRGVKVVLASGRPTYGVAPVADKLCLNQFGGYILSYNGGEIVNWQTKEVIYENSLDPVMIPYLYWCAKKNDFAIVTYHNEYVLTERPDDEYVLKEALLNVMTVKPVKHYLYAIDFPITKCLIVGEPSRLIVLEKEMYDSLKGRMGVYRSEPYFLELVPKGIDKAASLEVLLRKIGLTADVMIACGDGFNDISMIKYAGLGVAMANAQQEVRDNADFITGSNDEDGIVKVIEKFML